jgi:hypothetical protein
MIAAQEMGGSNFGTSLAQIDQVLLGGHTTKKALAELAQLGLLDRSGRAVDAGLLQTDPDTWFQRHFAPAVDRLSHGDTSKRDAEIRQLFPRVTAQQLAEMLGWQMAPGGRFFKDALRLQQAMTPEQAVQAAMGNLATSSEDVNTQFERLATNLGDALAKPIGQAYGGLFGPIRGAADWAGQHPNGALGADLIAGGAAGGLGLWGVWKLIGLLKTVGIRLGFITAKAAPAAEGLGTVSGALAGLDAIPFGALAGYLGVIGVGIAGLAYAAKGFADPKTHPAIRGAEGASLVPPIQSPGVWGGDGLGGMGGAFQGLWWLQNPSAVAPPPAPSGGHLQGAVFIDGKRAGKIILAHLHSGMNTNRDSGSDFDRTANFSPVGIVSI